MTTPPSTSRLPRPSLARASPSSSSSFRYVSPSTSTSTSKPKIKTKARSGSHPKILPFPELSLRAQEAQRSSREGSRAASPMSSPPIDRLEVTFDQMVSMSRGGSSEGNGTERRTSGGGSTSAGSGLAGSTSPPVPSPLAVSAARLSRARASTAPSRARGSGEGSDTTSRGSPSVTVGRATIRSGMPSPTPTSTPSRRTEGFRPASPALSRVTTNVHTTANNSLLTTNTSTSPSIQPRPVPTLLAPPTPVTPVTPAKHHTHPHISHTTHTQSPQPPGSTSPSTSTVAIAPLPSSSQIKDHLYQSFLTGVCADVRLVVKKWGVCYHVHRMVLVQTSFFHTLFLGGFSENHPNMRSSGKGKEKARDQVITDVEWNGDDVELTFDDPNITRAAFEICLSRLYSSHPHLQFPTDLLPTASYPLTPSFPHIPSPDYLVLRSSIPHKAQLVTPRLLLSLLATTIYLGHGAFMREVLASILRTVGPLTVGRYLSFALGDGIEDEEFPGQSEEGVKALSGIAKYIQNEDDHDRSYMSHQTSDEDLVESQLHALGHTPRSSSDSGTKIGDSSEESTRHGGIPIPSLRLPSRSNSIRNTHTTNDDPFSFTSTDAASLPHYYGVVGNKIGEACCCWLARWGVDLLNAELETPSPAFTIWGHGGLPAKLVRAVISSDYFFVPSEMERYRCARKVLDLRRSGWDEDNADAGDISLAASGTGLHEADESWEEWEEEEMELLKTFAEGIYYPHMTFDDLSTIAADIDPSTHLPYAPLSVLQAAHWAAADLRSRVTAHEKTGSPTTVDDENELGLTQTTTAICTSGRRRRAAPRSRVPSPAIPSSSTWGPSSPSSTIDSLPSLHSSQNTVWHAVPSDGTHKIGASGLMNQASSMQYTALGDMPDFGPDPLEIPFQPSSEPIEKARPPPQGERTAFGLMGDKKTGKEIQDKWVNEGGSFMISGLGLGDGSSSSNSRMAVGNGNEERWTKIEPYRFAVEFFDVDKLTEKERFYSSTHFYAGSYFNCYVQMIKRKEKGLQLGVYLHRQSPNEPFPIPSSPRRFDSSSTTSPLNTLAPPLAPPVGGTSPVTSTSHTRNLSTSPMVVPGSPPTTGLSPTPNAPASSGNNNDGAPYNDTRSTTKAFFSISCASALGTALIQFTSGPDSFALSQSWGWKSSALKSEEYLCVPQALPPREEEGDEHGVLGWSGEIPNTNGRYGQCSLRATVVVGVV